MKLSQREWALLWIVEGGNPRKADLASAVVMGESGGDAGSQTNPCCKGGYQINLSAHGVSLKQALNPIFATHFAIKESRNGRDWSIWEAYTDGAYSKYLGGSGVGVKPVSKKSATSELASNPIFKGIEEGLKHGLNPLEPLTEIAGIEGPSISNPFGGIAELASFFQHAGELFFTEAGWLRLGKMFGGSILLLWGLRILVRESTGADPVRTVKKVTEQAAATAAIVK